MGVESGGRVGGKPWLPWATAPNNSLGQARQALGQLSVLCTDIVTDCYYFVTT